MTDVDLTEASPGRRVASACGATRAAANVALLNSAAATDRFATPRKLRVATQQRSHADGAARELGSAQNEAIDLRFQAVAGSEVHCSPNWIRNMFA